MRSIHFARESFQESFNESMSSMIISAISVGDIVEIRCEEDGFLGSYYAAEVLAKKGMNKLLVQYNTLVSEEDHNVLLKETVEARVVRPLPPEIRVSEFKTLEKIDAYDNDGWWEGRIVQKIDSNYSVYFETTGDLLAYPSSRLRPHQDYVNGEWLRSPTKNYTVFLDIKALLRRLQSI